MFALTSTHFLLLGIFGRLRTGRGSEDVTVNLAGYGMRVSLGLPISCAAS